MAKKALWPAPESWSKYTTGIKDRGFDPFWHNLEKWSNFMQSDLTKLCLFIFPNQNSRAMPVRNFKKYNGDPNYGLV